MGEYISEKGSARREEYFLLAPTRGDFAGWELTIGVQGNKAVKYLTLPPRII
jgi:hypothetical protein